MQEVYSEPMLVGVWHYSVYGMGLGDTVRSFLGVGAVGKVSPLSSKQVSDVWCPVLSIVGCRRSYTGWYSESNLSSLFWGWKIFFISI